MMRGMRKTKSTYRRGNLFPGFEFRTALLLLLVLLGGIARPTPAQTAASAAAADRYAAPRTEADRQAKEWLARGIPGIAVAVTVDGKLVYSEGFGYADLENRVPVWPTSKFRIASISKPLSAAGLMKLVEAGKLDLDAPIQQYVPSFPDKGAKITPRMLAGHLGGIRHYQGDEFRITKHHDTIQEGLAIFENDPLISPPGTKFNYSSYGFNLLSAAMEAAAKQNFLDYMQATVFGPLGMAHTTPDQNARIVEERTRFYELNKDGAAVNGPYVDNSYKWAGGGFLSTAEDLTTFGNSLLRPGFLSDASRKTLFTSQKTAAGEETRYGIGWGVHTTKTGKKIYEHAGGAVGGSSQLILYPEDGVVIAVLSNVTGAPWKREEIEAIAERFAAAH